MSTPTSITDLPLDILVTIFPYLDAKSFLALCSTCKAFQQPSIRLDPAYWSHVTRSTFRVPNQPVVQHDGDRWHKLYKRLLTQSRVYTWGNTTHGRLGHSYGERVQRNPTMPRFINRRAFNVHCALPLEMENVQGLGVIADMQCGGWSTTLLTSTGSLHTAGILDGQILTSSTEGLRPLKFPAGYPSSSDAAQYEEPAIAIRQFSAGRSHILALSDSGKIWSWYNVKRAALQIKFANLAVNEISLESTFKQESHFGLVKQIVAGWSRSSALIQGIGIVAWDPVQRDNGEDDIDSMLVLDHAEIPSTGYQRTKDQSDEHRAMGEEVGVVLNYIILEHFVVFVTDIGRVFCGRFGDANKVPNVLELRQLRCTTDAPLDVQGSFRRFAVFKDGEVVTADQSYLENCWHVQDLNPEQNDIPGLVRIPALQKNVISVAFGDYHYLALHSDGTITSHGAEMQACGALGLGDERSSVGKARGIAYDQFNHQGRLDLPEDTLGRQVWFDHRKKEWLDHIIHGYKDEAESKERRDMWSAERTVQQEVSEWIEQEGRSWDQKCEDGLGTYFALRVSAAGWHSGAVVLVNEELAEREPTYQWQDKGFPRLKLADGREMPGEKEFDEWRQPKA